MRKILVLLLSLSLVSVVCAQGLTYTVGKHFRALQWADSVMNEMSLREKAAQLFMVNLPSTQSESNRRSVRMLIDDMQVGGIYFSGGSLADHVAMNNLVRSLSHTPVMIGFDGEWGLAMRIKTIPGLPKNSILGCIADDNLIYECGREVGRQCKAIGVNVDFAPVADVNTNPDNPVIGARSFGELPDNVARKAVAFAQGLENMGVLSVAKHFPGHGDTSVDSHNALPVLNHTLQRLDSVELYPFRKIAEEATHGVMVGHLAVPALEPDRKLPSSLSRRVIDVLTGDYGFSGLVFTDALAMKGVSGFEHVCVKALEAGNDIVLSPSPVRPQLDAVVHKARTDREFRKMIEAKCRRVLVCKYLLDVQESMPVQADGLYDRIVTPAYLKFVEQLYKAAVTVVSDRYSRLPVMRQGQRVAVLRFGGAAQVFADEVKSSARADVYNFANAAQFDAARKKLGKYATCIVPVTDEVPSWARQSLAALQSGNMVYVFFIQQKDIAKYKALNPASSAMIVANIDEPYMQRFAAAVVCGKAKADGRLSMSIPGVAKAGQGIDIVPDMQSYECNPEDAGMSSAILDRIDSIAVYGISQEAYPGCQILVMKDGKPVYNRCFGTHRYGDSRLVRYTDLYDVASMTKTSATLLAVMKLYEQRKIRLDDHIGKYLPWLKGTDKENLTIRSLLYHESGLRPSISFFKAALDSNSYVAPFLSYRYDKNHTHKVSQRTYAPEKFEYDSRFLSRQYNDEYKYQVAENMYVNDRFRQAALQMIADSPLGPHKYAYSCVGFIILKEIVEAVTGEDMDTYLAREFYYPMGLSHTLFRPLRYFPQQDIVPTVQNDYLHRGEICGYVHDDSAAFFGGVSGNAGLFSNAMDMGRLYQMILNGGEYDRRRYLSSATCHLFTTSRSKISRRGLGFDCSVAGDNSKSPCSPKTPAGVYGHTGFTGTCVWVDSANKLIFVFLSNRLYPEQTVNKLARLGIRSKIQDTIYEALKK